MPEAACKMIKYEKNLDEVFALDKSYVCYF